jgi:putative glutamine amidotransferase
VLRPVIGITTYVAEARWGFWELPAALVPVRAPLTATR